MGDVAGELCAERFHRGGGESYAHLSVQGIEEGVAMQFRVFPFELPLTSSLQPPILWGHFLVGLG